MEGFVKDAGLFASSIVNDLSIRMTFQWICIFAVCYILLRLFEGFFTEYNG
jgi:hypothetical protein